MNPARDAERKLEYLRRRVDDLERLVTAHNQAIPLSSLTPSRGGGGSAPMFGFADGDIPGRSGTTLGPGVVIRCTTTDGVLTETEVELNVYNPGGLISDGKLCVVQKDADGTLIVGPIECETTPEEPEE